MADQRIMFPVDSQSPETPPSHTRLPAAKPPAGQEGKRKGNSTAMVVSFIVAVLFLLGYVRTGSALMPIQFGPSPEPVNPNGGFSTGFLNQLNQDREFNLRQQNLLLQQQQLQYQMLLLKTQGLQQGQSQSELSQHGTVSHLPADAIFARSSAAVVQVVVEDNQGHTTATGSGFVVSKNGLIATNYHVMANAQTAHVVLADQTTLPVLGAAAAEDTFDLAIIKVAGPMSVEPLVLAGNGLPRVGAKVYAIGNPLGLERTLSDGLVSGLREIDGVTVIRTSAPISPGSSGGPLLAEDGRVVGVTTFGFKGGQNLNFAIPASCVARLLLECKGDTVLKQFPLVPQPDSSAHIKRRNGLMAQQDKAIRDYNEAIRLDPNNVAAYCNRGNAYSFRALLWRSEGDYDKAIRDFDKAIRDFDEAIRLDPKNVAAYCGRGDVWDYQHEYDKAIQDYNEAIRLDPKNVSAFFNRANSWSNRGDLDKAIGDYDEAIRLDPKNVVAYFAYCGRGDAWSGKGDFDKSMKDYNEAIQLDPKNNHAYCQRGDAWLHKQDYDKAIRDCNEAIRLGPNNVAAYCNRGDAWLGKQLFDNAIRDYNEAIRIMPSGAFCYLKQGNAWSCKGENDKAIHDYDEAIRLYDEAIRLDPKNAVVYCKRGDAWLGKRLFNNAIRDFDEAIRLDPKNADAYCGRALSCSKKNDYDNAIRDYSEAIRLDPKNAVAYLKRGVVWSCKQDYDKAIKDYNEAIRLDPKNFKAYGNRAYLWAKKGDYDKAIRDCDEANRFDPNFVIANARRQAIMSMIEAHDKQPIRVDAEPPPPPAPPHRCP